MIPNATPPQENTATDTAPVTTGGAATQATAEPVPQTAGVAAEVIAGDDARNGNGKRPRDEDTAATPKAGATSDNAKDGPGRKKKKKNDSSVAHH